MVPACVSNPTGLRGALLWPSLVFGSIGASAAVVAEQFSISKRWKCVRKVCVHSQSPTIFTLSCRRIRTLSHRHQRSYRSSHNPKGTKHCVIDVCKQCSLESLNRCRPMRCSDFFSSSGWHWPVHVGSSSPTLLVQSFLRWGEMARKAWPGNHKLSRGGVTHCFLFRYGAILQRKTHLLEWMKLLGEDFNMCISTVASLHCIGSKTPFCFCL